MDADPMHCATARELISAAIDDEVDAATLDHLDAHLGACPDCLAWQTSAFALRRSLALTPARAETDLTAVILARAGVPDVGRGEWVRALLGAIALTLLLVNLPMLITGSAAGADVHVGRHLGAFGVALAIGLGYAALRPERALGMLPLAGALGATLAATAIIDTATGTSTMASEIRHLVELLGVVMLWVISGGRHRLADRLASLRRPAPAAGLRAVE
jgi:predicted anti-sigma-YlaC factor YlaD